MFRTATKVTFTPEYNRMTEEERVREQMAAYQIVANNGGTIEMQYVLWTDRVLLTVACYPTFEDCAKAEFQILARGAFELESQRALPLDEAIALQTAAKEAAVVEV